MKIKCNYCDNYFDDTNAVCPNCGALLDRHEQDSGVRAIRQGRVSASAPTLPSQQGRTREYGDYDLSSLPLESESSAQRRRPS